MAETTKTKVIDIQTGKAQKGVKSLKQVIKELRDEMALLEKGTAEYDAMSKKLADAMQKQREIAEAAKYSNKDIGATLGNIATVGAGAVGAINGVSAALQLVGVEGEDAEKALKNIQLTMALIQGLSSIDTALKAIKGLGVAFKGLNTERITNTTTTLGAAGAETAEAAALAANTKKTYDNIEAAKIYTTEQIRNTKETKKSSEALYKEAGGLEAVAAARQGDMSKLEQYRAELAKLQTQQAAQKDIADDIANVTNNEEIADLENKIKFWENKVKLHKDRGHLQSEVEYAEKMLLGYQMKLALLKEQTEDSTQALMASWNKLVKDGFQSWDDSIESSMDNILKAMSPEQLDDAKKSLDKFLIDETKAIEQGLSMGFIDEEEYYNSLEMLENYANERRGMVETAINQNLVQTAQENNLKRAYEQTAQSINAETAAENANTKAKQQNAGATNAAAGAEANLGKTAKTVIPLQTRIANGIRGLGTAIKSFIASNPILLAIAAAIGAIAAGIAIYTNAMKKANKERREMAEIANNVNHSYEEENVRLRTLLQTVNDAYETQAERKKAYEELNKIIPEYNAHIDETTGAYTANTKALDDYLKKMKEKMLLEAYEGKIKEYMQEQLDLQQKITKIQNSGWNLFGWRINDAKKKIKELDKDIDRMYRNILNLDLSKALDDNKVNNTVKQGATKTVKEILSDIKKLFKDFWATSFDLKELRKIWHGVYNEVDMAMLNLKKVIKTNLADGYLSKEFKEALNEGFPEDMRYKVTIDWVLDDKQYKSTLKKMKLLEENIRIMMTDPKRYEKELPAQQKHLEKLKEQAAAYKAILEATQNYFDVRAKQAEAEEKRIDLQDEYLAKLEIEREYQADMHHGNEAYASINKEISLNELTIKQLDKKKQARDSELAALQVLKKKYDEDAEQAIKNGEEITEERILQTKVVVERIKELNQQEIDDTKTRNDTELKLEDAYYQARMQNLQEFYDKADAKQASRESKRNMERTLAGWGVQDYNTELDNLLDQYNAVMQKIAEVNAYYKQQVKDGLLDEVEAEMEKNAVIEQLQLEASEKAVAIKEAEVARKIAISETYVSAYQAVTGEISQLLSAEMSMYDQNSKQYKNLAYTQGVVDVTSGTLAAFMSGIKSGIPAPYNLILAAAMAATTFTTGLIQLQAIKKNSLENTTASGSKVSFGSYDTLAYAQNSDILSSISDQKVYVTETDITSTQNRVSVRETNSTF